LKGSSNLIGKVMKRAYFDVGMEKRKRSGFCSSFWGASNHDKPVWSFANSNRQRSRRLGNLPFPKANGAILSSGFVRQIILVNWKMLTAQNSDKATGLTRIRLFPAHDFSKAL